MTPEERAREVIGALLNPEPHPLQEEWSEAHSMTSEQMVKRLADAIRQAEADKDARIAELEQQIEGLINGNWSEHLEKFATNKEKRIAELEGALTNLICAIDHGIAVGGMTENARAALRSDTP